MLSNRSIPHCSVIPELPYANVTDAAAWLANAFGFTVRLTIGDHRVQMNAGDCAIVVVEGDAPGCRVLVRVNDVDAHAARARNAGATIVREPADHAYGERQYTARDPGGHAWTFSQSIADVAPEAWGGVSVAL
ncbi:MAG: VOC family protein [Acidobacteria bacterium]|nr:VOC family protein [Acidobacteriota bacterium]MBV9478602.1 VOC family protein [Acidobacteriota bacterium]